MALDFPSQDFSAMPRLCVIPARGGSKRIPRKNIRIFRGFPMIAWSIKAATEAGCFDRVVVSTDDSQIMEIASSYGAEVPFKRPDALSDDFVGTREVVEHCIHTLRIEGQEYSEVCCLYATAPFVLSSDIESSLSMLMESRPGSVVFSSTSYPFPIQRALRVNSDGYSSPRYPDSILKRSQDLEEFYHDAGQFYWATSHVWSRDFNLFDSGRCYRLPRWRVQDIDTEEDWKRAELMHAALG